MGSCTARGFELRQLKALPTPACQDSSRGQAIRCHCASTARWHEGHGSSRAVPSKLQSAGAWGGRWVKEGKQVTGLEMHNVGARDAGNPQCWSPGHVCTSLSGCNSIRVSKP